MIEVLFHQGIMPYFLISSVVGVTDQIGGQKNIMYGKKKVLEQIEKFTDVSSIINGISKDLMEYQKNQNRRDDLTLFGFSIS